MRDDGCAGLAAVTHQVRRVTLDDGQRASLLLENGQAAGLVVKGRPVALGWGDAQPAAPLSPSGLKCAQQSAGRTLYVPGNVSSLMET